jgi:hypothetical protein
VDSPEHKIDYFVNGERQVTTERKLTVAQILEHAGFTPPAEYQLERDRDHQKFTDLNQEIEIHGAERFTATFIGPTPTS